MYYYNQNTAGYHLCFALMPKYAITENYKYLCLYIGMQRFVDFGFLINSLEKSYSHCYYVIIHS